MRENRVLFVGVDKSADFLAGGVLGGQNVLSKENILHRRLRETS